MDSTPFISGRSMGSSSRVFISALLNWATLCVDPTGEALPTYVRLPMTLPPGYHVRALHTQTPQQQQVWNALITYFYTRITTHLDSEDHTFAPHTVAKIEAQLAQLPPFEQLVQTLYFPEPMVVGVYNPHHKYEDRVARQLTEYMLHLSQDEAVHFLEHIVILWAARLPDEDFQQLKDSLTKLYPRKAISDAYVRSYALYLCIVEQLER